MGELQLRQEIRTSRVRRNLLDWFPFAAGSTALCFGEQSEPLLQLLAERGLAVRAAEGSQGAAGSGEPGVAEGSGEPGAAEGSRGAAGSGEPGAADSEEPPAADYILVVQDILRPDADLFAPAQLAAYAAQLAPGGTLFLAMQNAMGLRYFAGARDAAAPAFFGGPAASGGASCTRPALEKALAAAGLAADFYYPWPDYVFPTDIFSDHFLPSAGDLRGAGRAYAPGGAVTFSEEAVYAQLLADGQFPYFANSFLVIARRA